MTPLHNTPVTAVVLGDALRTHVSDAFQYERVRASVIGCEAVPSVALPPCSEQLLAERGTRVRFLNSTDLSRNSRPALEVSSMSFALVMILFPVL